MGPIQVVVEDGNNLVLEVTPTPDTTVILDRGIAGPPGPAGDGDVDGPASSADNAVARFDGTTGKVIQNSNVTIDDSGNLTYSAGTANGVAYLNGSKVLTTGSALTFNGTNLGVGSAPAATSGRSVDLDGVSLQPLFTMRASSLTSASTTWTLDNTNSLVTFDSSATWPFRWLINSAEQMRLTSTGLGIGTSSPAYKLDVVGSASISGSVVSNGFRVTGASNVSGAGIWGVDTVLAFNTSSTERMRLDSSGNLGIGTSSPASKLDVLASANRAALFRTNQSAAGIELQDSTTTLNPGLYSNGNNLLVYTGAAERMRLDTSGNLGLGVTPSAWDVSIKAIEISGASLGAQSAATWLLSNAYVSSGGGYKYKASGVARGILFDASGTSFLTAPSGTAGDAITFTQAMTLDASGNVGIGTTSIGANHRLEVSGAQKYLAVTANAGNGGIANPSSSSGLFMSWNRSNGDGESNIVYGTGAGTSPALAFGSWNGTTYAERARIDSSGNLLVGTTGRNEQDSNSFSLDVQSKAMYVNHANGTSSGNGYVLFGYNAVNIGSITQSGTTAVLYNVTSDQRLKENIVDAPEFGSVIDSIKVRSYDWKTDQTHQRAGFIAQELVTVAPEAVHQPADPEAMMAVDYSKLVPMLVKEIQSLRARVAALESI